MPEYKFGNDVFTVEEVKQRAEQLGMTLDQYLEQNPEVKPFDAGKQNGTTTLGPVEVSDTESKSVSGSSEPSGSEKAYAAYTLQTDPTEEQISEIDLNFSDTSIFDVQEKTEAIFNPKSDKFRYKKTQTVPYEELLLETQKELGPEATAEQIKEKTLEKLRSKELDKVKKQNQVNFLESLEDGEIPPLTKEYWKEVGDIPVKADKLKEYITKGAENYNKNYTLALENTYSIVEQSNKIIEDLTEYNERFESGEQIADEDVEDYLAKYNAFTSLQKDYDKAADDLGYYALDIEDSASQLALLKKNYDDLEKFGVSTLLAFKDFGAKAAYGLSIKMESRPMNLVRTLQLKKVLENSNAIREKYSDDITFDSAFDDATSFGKYSHQLLANQLPILASLAIPGGWSALLESSFGDRYKDMTLEDLENVEHTDEQRNKVNKLIQSYMYAIPEVVLDRATTGLRLKAIGQAFTGSQRELYKKGLKESITKSALGTGVDSFAGGVSEGSTQVIQNVLTGKPVLEGVAEATFSGVYFDGVLSSVPAVKGIVMNQLSDIDTYKEVRDIQDEINSFIALRNGNETLYNSEINDLIEKRDAKVRDIEAKIKGTDGNLGMSASTADLYVRATYEQEILRSQAEAVLNSELNQAEKDIRLKDLKNKFDLRESARKAFNKEKASGYVLLNEGDKQEFISKALKRAEEQGITVKDGEIDNLARIEYDRQYIEKNLAAAKKNKLDENLVVVRNKKDLEKYMKENEAVAEAAKEAYEEGTHGFAIKGDLAVVFVENMAKDGRTKTRTHELFHNLAYKAFKNDNTIFNGMANSIIEWTKANDQTTYNRLIFLAGRGKDNKLIADEVIAVFMEDIANNKVKLNNNKGLLSLLGFGASKSLEKIGLDVDIAGVDDTINLIYGIAKKIDAGTLTEADISKLSEVEQAEFIKKEGLKTIEKGIFAIGEDFKKSKQTQKKIDDLGNKYTREEWTKFGADATLADIYEDLESLIRSKIFMFKNLPNFSPEDFVTGVLAELIPHIRNFNIDKKIDKGDKFGLSGWINSQLANKMGNVLKAKTATTETYSVDEDAEGFKERVETEDALETFEEEDLSIQAQLRERNLSQREGGDYEYSKFRRELEFNGEKGISNKMKQAIEAKTFEILSSSKYIDLPFDIISKSLQKDFEVGLKNIVQEQMGAESDYSNFLMKNMNTILKHLDIKSLTSMERETLSKDRIMTEFVRRLTTKKDVQDAIDNGWLAHVDNPAQGPNLYKVLKPNVSDYLKFYNPPSVIESPRKVKQWDAMPDAAKQQLAEGTGKTLEQARRQFVETRSVKKGERKKVLAERIVGQLAFDATMQTVQGEAFAAMREKSGKPVLAKAKIAELARRIDRGIEVKFSKKPISQGVAAMASDLIDGAIKQNSIISDIKLTRKPIYKLYSQEDKQLAVDLANLLLKSSKIESELSRLKKLEDKPNIKRLLELHNMNIDEAIDSPNKEAYLSIKYSKKNRDQYIARLKKRRLDIQDRAEEQVDAIFDFLDMGVETGQIKKKSRIERYAFHWLINSNIILPEDGYKIIRAVQIADAKKEDPGSYRNPNILIERYAEEVKEKVQRTNPDKVKELSNKQLVKGKVKGVTVYDVEDSKAGQIALRKIVDTHWGEKSDPWCCIARTIPESIAQQMAEEFGQEVDDILQQAMQSEIFQQEASVVESSPFDDLASSFDHWKSYNHDGNGYKVSFVDGKLNSFRDGNKKEWWNRMDMASNDLVATTMKRVGESLHVYDTNVRTGDKVLVQEQLGVSGKNGPIINYTYFGDQVNKEYMTMKKGRIDSKVILEMINQDPSTEARIEHKHELTIGKASGIVKANIILNNIKSQKISSMEGITSEHLETMTEDQSRRIEKKDGGIFSEHEVTGTIVRIRAPYTPMDLKSYVGKEVTVKKTVFRDMMFSEKITVDGVDVKFSKKASALSSGINDMIERSRGIPMSEIVSGAAAKIRGKEKDSSIANRLNMFVPPSADDFVGLTYYMLGKGKQGDADMKFFKDNLVDPFSKAYTELDEMRMAVLNDTERMNFKDEITSPVFKKLKQKMPNSVYTYEQAIRVYLWDKHNYSVPGLSNEEVANLVGRVNAQPELVLYAFGVESAARSDKYIEPKEYWTASSIAGDINRIVEGIHRANFLSEWKQNKDEIFSKDNLNKLEAAYGTDYRSALEDMLYRMETGNSRPQGKSKITNAWINWLNGSVGAIMFFNSKSAVLQTISTVNYINWEENNILAAAEAFADQDQYWKDWAMIYNSDYLKSRRSGLKTDIQHAELASTVAKAGDKAKAALAYLLKIGFAPTQAADSFAIATGGAAFYRNRVNKLIKEGMAEAEAEAQAFIDFREISEKTQQSARPDMVSQQQTSTAGRLILAFQNAPMQFNRLMKKAVIDLQKGRGDWKSNVSRIVYYGAVQNIIFLSLQQALFALAFDDDEEDLTSEELEKRRKFENTKYDRILNGMFDTLARGSGVTGATIAVLKNTAMKFYKETQKGKAINEYAILVEALQISPQIGSKVRKIVKGSRSYKWDSDAIDQMSLLDSKNPVYSVTAPIIEGATNIPLNRLLTKVNNLREMADSENTPWQRAALALGWSAWDLGVDAGKEVDEAKKKARAEEKKSKGRCKAVTSSGTRCKNTAGASGRCYLHD